MITPGQSVADISKIYQGRTNSKFTDLGIDQMCNAAETLSHYKFDMVFASDLYPSQELLSVISKYAKFPLNTILAEELRERSGGAYEGSLYSDIRVGKSPRQYRVWERDPFEAPLHGESLIDVQDRLTDWFKDIRTNLQLHKNILLITHSDVIKVIIALARGDDLADTISINIEPAIPYFYYGNVPPAT